MLATDVDRIQSGPPEWIVGKNRRQDALERKVLNHEERQRRETDAGAHGVRDSLDRSVAQDNSRGYFDLAVGSRKLPRLCSTNHDTVVPGEILGGLRHAATLQILPGGRNDERH